MKWFRVSFILGLCVLFSVFWIFPQSFHIVYAKHFLFKKITENIYSTPGLTIKEQKQLMRQYEVAADRIQKFWNFKIGSAPIFYCQHEAVYQRLCQSPKGSGCSVITPFGSWIILNYNGMDEDVIAHEMCHDELAARVGWWVSRTKISKWKDEGLALQLDNRFVTTSDSIQRYINYKAELKRFSMNNEVAIPLAKLQTEKQFFGGDPVYTQLAYLTSATEVARLISIKGRQKVLDDFLSEK